ncbi:MAG: hypothetical protein R3Y28_06025 [Candidatus Gastranaerophilales bacterium]
MNLDDLLYRIKLLSGVLYGLQKVLNCVDYVSKENFRLFDSVFALCEIANHKVRELEFDVMKEV